MSVHAFGVMEGRAVDEIRLRSPAGARASILTWGAILHDLVVPLASGATRRVVLGYEGLEGYAADPYYMGATVGRFANRIADGRFELDGTQYALPVNGAGHVHLHGGPKGFSRQHWHLIEHDEASVLLMLVSGSGDQGYPGRVETFCHYALIASATLRITMTARTDVPTIVSMTNHSYFTLKEDADGRSHRLQVNADFYTPLHDNLIPTGEIRSVAGTQYDFRTPKPIAEGCADSDNSFLINAGHAANVMAARLISPGNDLQLQVTTNEPNLLFYTGAGLAPTVPGLGGQKHFPFAGVCLEAQRIPDTPNRRHFGSAVLRPGEVYCNISEYSFATPAEPRRGE